MLRFVQSILFGVLISVLIKYVPIQNLLIEQKFELLVVRFRVGEYWFRYESTWLTYKPIIHFISQSTRHSTSHTSWILFFAELSQHKVLIGVKARLISKRNILWDKHTFAILLPPCGNGNKLSWLSAVLWTQILLRIIHLFNSSFFSTFS